MIIIPIIPKEKLDGFEVKFSAITKEMAFYLNVFNSISAKSLTPSDIAFDIYVTRSDNTPLIRLFACSIIQNIVEVTTRYCNIMVSDNKYVDLHGIDFDPSKANALQRNFTTVYLTSTSPSSTGKKFMFGGLQISTTGNFDPSMKESWGLECINIEILR